MSRAMNEGNLDRGIDFNKFALVGMIAVGCALTIVSTIIRAETIAENQNSRADAQPVYSSEPNTGSGSYTYRRSSPVWGSGRYRLHSELAKDPGK